MSKRVNITIIEASAIIRHGIESILSESGLQHKTTISENLNEISENTEIIPNIVFVNPVNLQNKVREFNVIKKNYPDIYWAGIVYSLTDQQILSLFDDIIYINDPPGKIISLIKNAFTKSDSHFRQEILTERETEVLKLLVAGKASKEIADNLNISTHTVITHRKNISQKTGIKSVSGLTIYAVMKNLISVKDYKE
ncbi:MAG TPA: LuxR C-terminal-related transcriptional regulator [Bacteroidales bacterium]|nr:LuxR C-terminal-related transcriptional regulator [Bacteroidales bacterium]